MICVGLEEREGLVAGTGFSDLSSIPPSETTVDRLKGQGRTCVYK